jgi:hypothetical protein
MVMDFERPTLPHHSWATSVEDVARELLASHPHFRGRIDLFEFAWSSEALVVRGRVPTFYLKQLVQCVLKGVHGVRRIDNQVTVVTSDGTRSAPPPHAPPNSWHKET